MIGRCIDAGLAVEVLPGPSAVTTALVASGIGTDSWRFVGFLPKKAGALKKTISGRPGESVVCFESPQRLGRTLALLAEYMPERQVAVCRELTKVHEEVVRGSVVEVASTFSARSSIKGEVVIVIEGEAEKTAESGEAASYVEALADLVDAGAKPRNAAKVVAQLARPKVTANSIYKAWLKQK